MITNFKLFENRISDSMWSKLTMDSSSPTHYLKPNVLKDGDYIVEYREKFLDGLLLQYLGLNKTSGSIRFPYYDFKVIDELGWHYKNGFYSVGKTHGSFGPAQDLDTVLYIGADLEEAKLAFQKVREIVGKLKTINRFDL